MDGYFVYYCIYILSVSSQITIINAQAQHYYKDIFDKRTSDKTEGKVWLSH